MIEETNTPPAPQNDKYDANGNLKPPTVPLFQIPDAVLNSMSKETAPDISKFANPVEWIMAQRKFAEAQVQGPQVETAQPMPPPIVSGTPSQAPSTPIKKTNVPVVSWGGNDLDLNALTMLFYMVIKEVSKDKKTKKYLKDLNIEIYNINGDLLWP